MTQPGEFVPEYIVTATDMNGLPGGVLGYAEVTSDQAGIAADTVTDLTGLSAAVDLPANRRLRITAKVSLASSSDGTSSSLIIREGTTNLGGGRARHTGATSIIRERSIQVSAVISPSSGLHTYKAAVQFTGDTGASKARTGEPSFILVEDIGPT